MPEIGLEVGIDGIGYLRGYLILGSTNNLLILILIQIQICDSAAKAVQLLYYLHFPLFYHA